MGEMCPCRALDLRPFDLDLLQPCAETISLVLAGRPIVGHAVTRNRGGSRRIVRSVGRAPQLEMDIPRLSPGWPREYSHCRLVDRAAGDAEGHIVAHAPAHSSSAPRIGMLDGLVGRPRRRESVSHRSAPTRSPRRPQWIKMPVCSSPRGQSAVEMGVAPSSGLCSLMPVMTSSTTLSSHLRRMLSTIPIRRWVQAGDSRLLSSSPYGCEPGRQPERPCIRWRAGTAARLWE